MRFSLAILAAVVASASASSLYPRQAPSIPTCASECIAKADVGNCAGTDNACLCKNEAFVKSTTECITTACKGDDLTAATAAAQALCAQVGVTLAPPAATGAANGTTPSPTNNATAPGPAPSGGANSTAPGTNSTGSTNGTSTNGTSGNGTSSGAGPAPTSGATSNALSSIAGVAALGLAALVL